MRGGRPGLALKAARTAGVGGEGKGQQFERDVAAEARVARGVDLAHPAAADLALDPVPAQHAPCKCFGSDGREQPVGNSAGPAPGGVFGFGTLVGREE